MQAHQWRVTLLSMFILAFSIAILALAGVGLAADGPAQGRDSSTGPMPRHPVSSLSGSAHITITTAGFDPAVLTVTVGTEVTWTNATAMTHILRSGVPWRIFLPVVLKNSGGSSGWAAERAAPIPRTTDLTLASGESFSATLPPGGTFTHTFTSFGDHPFFLATAPQFSGQVIVPGITGGQKPVTPVYQPPLDNPVGLAVNGAETVAYVVEKGAGRLVAVDIDPASLTYRAITPIASGLEDLQMGVALDPSETYAYVVENEPGNLKQVNITAGQVATIATGLHYPHDVALNLDGTRAYVTLYSGALVSVTIATGQVYTVTDELRHPEGLALSPDGTQAFVADPGQRVMQQVNLTTGDMNDLDAGVMPHAVALDPSGNKAYVASGGHSELCKIDVATGQEERYAFLPFRVSDIVINATDTQAYVLWRWLGQIAVMNLDTWEADPILDALFYPTGVALNSAETHAYVLEQDTGDLSRIALNPASPDYGRPVRVASVGAWNGMGGALAVSADETWALVVKTSHDDPPLLHVDLTTGQTSTVTTFPFGALRGVALSPDEQFAYVTGDDQVRRVDLATGDTVYIGNPNVYGGHLNGCALTADGNALYVAQRPLNRLLKVDVTTGDVITVASNLHLPVGVALAPGETTAWVLEEGRAGTLIQVDLASGGLLAEMPIHAWIGSNGGVQFMTGWTDNLAVTADGTTAYVPMAWFGPKYLYRVDLTGSSNVRVLYRPPMLEVADAALNQAETRAYLIDVTSQSLYQLDTDPASPDYGTLSVLVDGIIYQPAQVVLSPDETTLVVAHYGDHLMHIRASDGTVLGWQWVDSPERINGLALHPTQPLAYVTTEDGSLREVELDTEAPNTVIASGLDDPRGVVLNGAGTVAYLVERNAGRLVAVTLSTGAVHTVTADLVQPLDVALDEVGGVAYVLDDVPNNHRISKVDLANGDVEWAYTGEYTARPTGIASAIVLSQDRQHIYLARAIPGALWRIDLAQAAGALTPPSTGIHPISYHPEPVYEEVVRQQAGALSPDGRRLYLCDEFAPRLVSLDLDTGRLDLVTGLEWSPYNLAVTPDEQTIYYTPMHTDGLIAVNLETVTTHFVYSGNAFGLALDPIDPNFAYTMDEGAGEVFRLNLTTGTPSFLPFQFGEDTAGPLAVNAAGTHLYVVPEVVGERGDYPVVRLDLSSGVSTTVAVVDSQGDCPTNVIIDDAERYAYVSEMGVGMTRGGTRGGAVRRVDVDPASPTYGQVDVVVPDVGEIFPLALDPTGSRLIVGGGMAYVIFEVD